MKVCNKKNICKYVQCSFFGWHRLVVFLHLIKKCIHTSWFCSSPVNLKCFYMRLSAGLLFVRFITRVLLHRILGDDFRLFLDAILSYVSYNVFTD